MLVFNWSEIIQLWTLKLNRIRNPGRWYRNVKCINGKRGVETNFKIMIKKSRTSIGDFYSLLFIAWQAYNLPNQHMYNWQIYEYNPAYLITRHRRNLCIKLFNLKNVGTGGTEWQCTEGMAGFRLLGRGIP